jgi:hypothetical protein
MRILTKNNEICKIMQQTFLYLKSAYYTSRPIETEIKLKFWFHSNSIDQFCMEPDINMHFLN